MSGVNELAVRRARARWALVVFGIVVVGIAGYLGFVGLTSAEHPTGYGTMALAAATGFAAFFSPCSFPLMLTFLARQSGGRTSAVVRSAARVGLGAAALLVIVGAALAVGSEFVASALGFATAPGRIMRGLIGVFLIAMGLHQARLVKWRIDAFDRIAGPAARTFDPTRGSSPATRDFLYGFGYLLAGFG